MIGIRCHLEVYQSRLALFGNYINSRLLSNECQQGSTKEHHVPVMSKEVMKYLKPTSGSAFIDMTFGAGGHTRQILQSSPNVKVYALDRDPVAYGYAEGLAEEYPGQVIPLLGRFSELPELLKKHKVMPSSVDGFLFDFGCSSMQFDVADRGFSLSKDGPLDMRMDGSRFPGEPTVADVLARADETDLAQILKVYGQEKAAKKIARAIIDARYMFKTLKTTSQLAELVASVSGDGHRTDRLGRYAHSATKTFQAFRIFINNELNEINYGMFIAERYLKQGGRLITISFHSLEDTIIKRHLTGSLENNQINILPPRYTNCSKWFDHNEMETITRSPWSMLHKHVITPETEEVETNPRSRSAKFRAIMKV